MRWVSALLSENGGRTVARITRSYIRPVLVKSEDASARPLVPILPLPPDYATDAVTRKVVRDGTIWAPEETFNYAVVLARSFFEEGFRYWSMGNQVLCIYALIEYEDAFKQGHISSFCYAYQFIVDGGHLFDKTGRQVFPA